MPPPSSLLYSPLIRCIECTLSVSDVRERAEILAPMVERTRRFVHRNLDMPEAIAAGINGKTTGSLCHVGFSRPEPVSNPSVTFCLHERDAKKLREPIKCSRSFAGLIPGNRCEQPAFTRNRKRLARSIGEFREMFQTKRNPLAGTD
jgi:hypothetical protein